MRRHNGQTFIGRPGAELLRQLIGRRALGLDAHEDRQPAGVGKRLCFRHGKPVAVARSLGLSQLGDMLGLGFHFGWRGRFGRLRRFRCLRSFRRIELLFEFGGDLMDLAFLQLVARDILGLDPAA